MVMEGYLEGKSTTIKIGSLYGLLWLEEFCHGMFCNEILGRAQEYIYYAKMKNNPLTSCQCNAVVLEGLDFFNCLNMWEGIVERCHP